ncbi:MAG: 2-C-methyl-D-erythritol 2,4-cyclodiphosphate synthase [Tannerella sp.]|jgi:2-C-methyl-D-erythritol 2,4-cyclodiphosphate synthase|nr:2-C-methyl-D-erythritol 2,4-cyclodiphosphate synthase [Tannerella sp.]
MKIRTGFGYDVHAFAPGRALWLGGIRIDHPLGLAGHSDADVLIHAICDALLGAAGLRDIGYHFPDTADEYRGIDSKILLARTTALLRSAGYEPGNIDATVIAEEPKLSPYIPLMQQTLAEIMQIDPGDISVKATTTEKLGFTGRREGIAACAAVLILPANGTKT